MCEGGYYQQEGECVEQCSDGYGLEKKGDTQCIKCPSLKQNGICVNECDKNSYINSKNECVVIGGSDICQDNYCENGECEIVKGKATCNCIQGFIGLRCETENNTAAIDQSINEKLDKMFGEDSSVIDITDNGNVGEIKSLTYLIKEGHTTSDGLANSGKIKSQIETILDQMREGSNREKKERKGLLHLIGLGLVIQLRKLKSQTFRLLLDDLDDIRTLLDNAREFNQQLGKAYSQNINQDETLLEYDEGENIYYQIYSNTPKSISQNKNEVLLNGISLVDLSRCFDSNSKTTYIVTEVSKEIMNIIGSTNDSNNLYIDVAQNGVVLALPTCQNIIFKIPFNGIINQELYKFYKQRGIDIYNKNDPAFTEPCYYNDRFDYDLTQKYRRFNLFQKQEFTPSSSDCTYEDLDLETNLISFNCNKFVDDIKYTTKEAELDDTSNHVDNLPTKCGNKIGDIEDNIAFWLFLVLFIIFIVVDSVLAVLSLRGSVSEKALKNDELLNNDYTQAKSTEAVKPEDIKPQINKSFTEIFKNNFFALHPVLSLFYSSIITPLPLTLAIFIYTIFNLFGFNALYFNETMIEDRIYHTFRNNFAYPMKTEFEKIMSAITTSIALNIIVRLICLVTLTQKEELGEALKNNKKEIRGEVNKFNMRFLPRRIIAGVFMLGLSVFFYYYCVVFCGIYTNTQYGWFYSGIWSLMWNWIAYAPIYILIISLVENSGKTGCAYYMKKLFIF